MKLIYYNVSSHGGIADYAHYQANALCDAGADVTLLCTPKYPSGRGEKYRLAPVLVEPDIPHPVANKILKGLFIGKTILINMFRLADFIEKNGFKYVLFGTYTEYLAPLWAWRLRRLVKRGVVFGAVVHDPVRDFVVGPLWWHRWSIAEGYSFLQEAFVHQAIALDTARTMPRLKTTIIPQGPYSVAPASRGRDEARSSWNIPLDAKVMLFFGHIHPHRKNLDLVIKAMVDFPGLYLIVAGNDTSTGQSITSGYKALAQRLGVEDRCRWDIRKIPDDVVGDFFEACDVVMLIYKKAFCSASGVLNTAVSYRKPSIASCGEGALKSAVEKYGLGIWVEPDSLDSLIAGIKKWQESRIEPQWERYCFENSWKRNAELTLQAMAGGR